MTSLNDIADVVKNMSQSSLFLDKNFYYSEASMKENPIFPFRFNYEVNNSSITFCHIPIVTCWALKTQKSFSFFIILDTNEDISNSISKKFGKALAISETEINFKPNNLSYYWENGEINILLRKFHSALGNQGYENCSIVVIGNHTPYDLLVR